jgi:hypothetical protein
VNDNWAIRLSVDHLSRANELRLTPGIEAAIGGRRIWLSGDGLDASLQRVLASIADDGVFHRAVDGRLTAFGRAVPTERLPELKWQRLTDVLQPVLPVSQMAFFRIPRTGLSLRRSTIEHRESLLLTDWDTFRDWALAAPEIRLTACRFAVCRPSAEVRGVNFPIPVRVLIEGSPLPPLRGERYWVAGRVAIPLGFHWFPAVDVPTLEAIVCRARLAAESIQQIWIWSPNGDAMEEIPGSEMIAVTRANLRATEKALA